MATRTSISIYKSGLYRIPLFKGAGIKGVGKLLSYWNSINRYGVFHKGGPVLWGGLGLSLCLQLTSLIASVGVTRVH